MLVTSLRTVFHPQTARWAARAATNTAAKLPQRARSLSMFSSGTSAGAEGKTVLTDFPAFSYYTLRESSSKAKQQKFPLGLLQQIHSAPYAPKSYCIVFCDSGSGGGMFAADAVRVLKPKLEALFAQLDMPPFTILHLADTENAPYGTDKDGHPRPVSELAELTRNLVRYSATHLRCKTVVLACNTASTAVSAEMEAEFKELYPKTKVFTIIEKTAQEVYDKGTVDTDKNGNKVLRIGIFSTRGTFRSKAYQEALEKIHENGHKKSGARLEVYYLAPQNWVSNIEAGIRDDGAIINDVNSFIAQEGAKGVSSVGLACTHFPAYMTQIRDLFNTANMHPQLITQGQLFAESVFEHVEPIVREKYRPRGLSLEAHGTQPLTIQTYMTGKNTDAVKLALGNYAPQQPFSIYNLALAKKGS